MTPAERNYAVGEKELLAIRDALEEWRHWLEGAMYPTVVYTDHRNLEYLRTAKRLNSRQARWALFFSRFPLHITYRPGSMNKKADALSRRDMVVTENESKESDVILPSSLFLATQTPWWDQIRAGSTPAPPEAQHLPCREGLLYQGTAVYLPESCRLTAIQQHHDAPTAGHPGVARTLEYLSRSFWWPEMPKMIQDYVKACPTCARCKRFPFRTAGLLQPLPGPNRPWRDISMDFVVELPSSQKCNTILVIVDRFTKMAHFIPTEGLPTAQTTVDLFIDQVFRLHGIPSTIVTDRGTQFTSRFWSLFCQAVGIGRKLSSAYHPQTNGQTERVNQILEQYLRCYVNHLQDDWKRLLPFAEFSYNNLCQSSTKSSPFFANYGFHPSVFPDMPMNTPIPALSTRLRDLRSHWKTLQRNLLRAQAQHKRQADQRRIPAPTYSVGDKVWLRTSNLRLDCPTRKLGPQALGPFTITEVINPVAMRLELPASFRVHPVFHVSLLRPCLPDRFPGRNPPPPPPIQAADGEEYVVQKVLDSRVRRGKLEYLVRWQGYGPEEDTWVPSEDVHAPSLTAAFHRAHPDRPTLGCVRRPRLGGGPCQVGAVPAPPHASGSRDGGVSGGGVTGSSMDGAGLCRPGARGGRSPARGVIPPAGGRGSVSVRSLSPEY